MMTEQKTNLGSCGWYETKNGFINEFATCLNTHKWNIKVLCDYNAGQKIFLEEINDKYLKMGVENNWTPRATPQPN